jgi:hypothetical protein
MICSQKRSIGVNKQVGCPFVGTGGLSKCTYFYCNEIQCPGCGSRSDRRNDLSAAAHLNAEARQRRSLRNYNAGRCS